MRDALEWQQGSLLPADALDLSFALWAHPRTQSSADAFRAVEADHRRRPEERAATRLLAVRRSLKAAERLIVITQTCDILKLAENFPLVEVARVFATDNTRIIDEAQHLGSARHFRLDSFENERAWVVDFCWRTFLDKGFLTACRPDNGILNGWSAKRRQTFARWLGRRYSRPVLSDEDVRTITGPVRERWRRLRVEEPERARGYSAEYVELRYRREPDRGLSVFLLSPSANPDPVIAMEVAAVLSEALEPIHGQITFPVDRRSYNSFTVADEYTTQQIDMEWASHEEGEISAAIPPA